MKFRLLQTVTVFCLFAIIYPNLSVADVVLTFDQNGISDGAIMAQSYGDNVVSSPDGNNHSYDIIAGMLFGLTPNVQMSYAGGTLGGDATSWIGGFGDLTNVLNNETDTDDALSITFTADPGFEVGIFGFDMANFISDATIPGLEIRDGTNAILWSVDSPFLSGTTHTDFDFAGGVFANQLTIDIDLSGLGGNSDNVGIDNIHFVQRAVVPEPAAGFMLAMGVCGVCLRRRRH